MSIFHILKLKSARAYTKLFKLKLMKLIFYILHIYKVLVAYTGLIDIFVNFYDEEAGCAIFT